MKEILIALKLLLVFTLRYFLIAGLAFSTFYVLFSKKMELRKIQKGNASHKDFWREIWYSMQTNLVFVLTALLILFGPIKEHTKIYENMNDYPLWYLPLSLVLALIIHDSYFYWMHRTLHKSWLYKNFHRVHHLSTNPSPWASFSFHLGEAFLESLIVLLVVFLIPIHPWMLFGFTFASLIINVYGHLGYEIAPSWYRRSFLFEIFNSSVHHNMHHQYFEGNYGLYFRIWDRLMGTENPNYLQEYNKIQKQRFEN
ncbi:MAG: sterol desaturase family protein [Bacteroidetes bacterium]|nr:sterol desaturase family protein [Bacteroidota bacterium]